MKCGKQKHRRVAAAAAITVGLMTALTSRVDAVNSVSIGNAAEAPDGSYRNAQNIADYLTFTNVTVSATSNIDIVDAIDLGTSIFGTPNNTLYLQGSTLNLNHNVDMGLNNLLSVGAGTVNLAAKISSGANPIDPSRVSGSAATQINVLANTASIQQAVDLSAPFSPVMVQVSPGQYTESIAINKECTVRLSAGNATMLKAGTLSVAGGAKIDVTDNRMAVTGMPVGTFGGGAYNGVSGLIQSGRGNGTWNGNGLMTSMTAATSGVLTTLAVGRADELGYAGGAGGTFGGMSVTGSDVLVMYTWGGDADMNGQLNGDDYFWIDSNILANQSGANNASFHNGDFDYDGAINGDDYFILDSNILQAQASAPFPTGAGAGLTPVPEPTGAVGLLSLATIVRLIRRRKQSTT